MNRKNSCDKITARLYEVDLSEALPQELKDHIDACPECKKEYGDLLKMNKLITESIPETPLLSEKVIERIKSENITPAPPPKSRTHLPLGTIAAAAAVLAIYVSIYRGGGMPAIFSDINTADSTESLSVNDSELSEGTSQFAAKSTSGAAESEQVSYDTGDGATSDENLLYSSSYTESDSDEANSDTTYSYIPGMKTMSSCFYDYYDVEENADESAESEIDENCDGVIENGSGANGFSQNSAESDSTNGNGDSSENFESVETPNSMSDSSESSDILDKGFNADSYTDGSDTASSDSLKQSATELYLQIESAYPDRISRDLFELTEPRVYLSFVYTAVEDFETEYNEENLKAFATLNK